MLFMRYLPVWFFRQIGPAMYQMASSPTVSRGSASAGAGVSAVAASSFFMIEKINTAETRQMATRMPQRT